MNAGPRLVSPGKLTGLLDIASSGSDPDLAVAALDAASRYPLEREAWSEVARALRPAVMDFEPASSARREALKIAVRVPLMSVRQHLVRVAEDRDDPNHEVVAQALARAGDSSQLARLLEAARAGDSASFELLAGMPLEDGGVAPEELPAPADDTPDVRLWWALARARVGDFAPIDSFLEGAEGCPQTLSGDSSALQERIAAIRPVPARMHEHLISALERVRRVADPEIVRMAEIIVRAVAGTDDEEESIASEGEAPSDPARIARALEAAEHVLASDLADPEALGSDLDELAYLPPERVEALVSKVVREGNRRAEGLDPSARPKTILGNNILDIVSRVPVPDAWPVSDLAELQATAPRPALNDEQLAWVLSRARPEPTSLFRPWISGRGRNGTCGWRSLPTACRSSSPSSSCVIAVRRPAFISRSSRAEKGSRPRSSCSPRTA